MSFKIGDKVIVKNKHICELVFPSFNTKEMSRFCGKKAKITDIAGDEIYLDISSIVYVYFWNDKCLEKINQLVMETE